MEFMVFALCGGDERIVRLGSLLLADGHGVKCWALEDAQLAGGVRVCEGVRECAEGADCVVLPIPACRHRGILNAPLSRRTHCLGEVLSPLAPGTLVCAGGAGADMRSAAEPLELRLRDYGAQESYQAANSMASAEGAIGVLLSETDGVLCGSACVLIGAGRLSRALAPRLAALGVHVTVASRSADKLAWAAALGYGAQPLSKLDVSRADFVINTAPALTLTASRLTELPDGALVLDLASAPGGTDFDAARSFGIKALTAPGLPGKWSPDSAALFIKDAIYRILEDERLE